MEAGYKQAVTARVGIALLQYAAAYAVAERVKHLYTASGTSGEKYTENVLDKEGQIVATKGESASPQYDFYHYDIRNSVTNIVKSEGSTKVVPTQENEYDIFGKTEQSATNSSKNEVKFTGALHEQQNGLYYMNARHYDPSTGRFLQQDVYKGEYGAPWTQNRYTYCGNNPVNMVDPSGHAFLSILAAGLLGAGINASIQYLTTGQVNKKKVLLAGATSMIFSGFSAYDVGRPAYMAVGAISSAGNEIIDARDEKRSINRKRLLTTSLFGGASGLASGYVAPITNNVIKYKDAADAIISLNITTQIGVFDAVSDNLLFSNRGLGRPPTRNSNKTSTNKKSNVYMKPNNKQKQSLYGGGANIVHMIKSTLNFVYNVAYQNANTQGKQNLNSIKNTIKNSWGW